MTVMRAARPDEPALLADLQERSSVAALAHIFPPEACPFPRDAVRERWEAVLQRPAARTVVAELEGEQVGFASVHAGWLDALYVIPEQWGTGVANMLHDRALELVEELGSARCDLWVLEENARARRFYERRGWRENGASQVIPWPPEPTEVGYTFDF